MAFDKRAFNKTVKEHFTSLGYTPHKNRKDYYIDAPDGVTRLVVRIPDGKQGFEIGAQFADFRTPDGSRPSLVALTVCQHLLLDAAEKDYSPAEIQAAAKTVTDTLAPYIVGGKELIRANMNDFYENDPLRWAAPHREYNEPGAEQAQRYFGFPPVDVYSDEYRAYQAKQLRDNWAGRTCSVDMDAYLEHKEYYDGFLELGCTVVPMEDIRRVWIRGKRPEQKD